MTVEGISPLVCNRFAEKARQELHDRHAAGDQRKSKKEREPKDFNAAYEAAMHRSTDGWLGLPCSAFMSAMVSACRATGVVMTRAKIAMWIDADGYSDDGYALTKITKGKPRYDERYVRNQTGVVDLRARPMWDPGWQAVVTISFDRGMISPESIANLLSRAGRQVGIQEGRPDSKKSVGMGWGLFKIVNT